MRSAVTLPELSTLAVNGLETLHVAALETSLEVLSEYTRIAESRVGMVVPITTEEFAGTMLRAVGIGGPICKGALFDIDPVAAEIVTVPCLSVVTRPAEFTAATVASEVDQVSDDALTIPELPFE